MKLKRLFPIALSLFVTIAAQAQDTVEVATSDEIVASLQKTLATYKNGTNIRFAPEAAEFVDAVCNEEDTNFYNSFKGLTKSVAYYYLFRMDLDGVNVYGVSEEELAKSGGNADTLLNALDSAQIKILIDSVIPTLSTQDKTFLRAFLTNLKEAYAPFKESITPEDDKMLRMVAANNYGFLRGNVFYEIGLPRPKDECYEQMAYTSPIEYGDDDTYFVFDSMDFYDYSFWLRRYRAGTMEKAKELIDYSVSKL